MCRQSLGGTIPIMRDGGHLLTQGKQLVHMRGLCLFEAFKGLIALAPLVGQLAEKPITFLVQFVASAPLHIEDGLKPLGSFLGCVSSSLCRGKPFSPCSPYVAILPQLVHRAPGARYLGLGRAELPGELGQLGL